jgi:hypothetical protein
MTFLHAIVFSDPHRPVVITYERLLSPPPQRFAGSIWAVFVRVREGLVSMDYADMEHPSHNDALAVVALHEKHIHGALDS